MLKSFLKNWVVSFFLLLGQWIFTYSEACFFTVFMMALDDWEFLILMKSKGKDLNVDLQGRCQPYFLLCTKASAKGESESQVLGEMKKKFY